MFTHKYMYVYFHMNTFTHIHILVHEVPSAYPRNMGSSYSQEYLVCARVPN